MLFRSAIPPLLGWVAATGTITGAGGLGGWILFFLQFIWQFPHFWAIAWIAYRDYEQAGFRLLPSVEGPTKYSAIQSVVYSLVLVPVGMLPYWTGLSGRWSFWIVLGANLVMVLLSFRLYTKMERQAARRVMFTSYIYLPVVLLALLADKIR